MQNKKGKLALDKPNATIEISSSKKLPNSVRVMSQTEFDLRFGTVNKTLPSSAKKFTLFFKPQSMLLTEESQAHLSTITSTIQQNMPCIVDIIGHTDTTASKSYNLKLGLERAKAVSILLEARGINKRNLKLRSYGEEVLFIQTADNVRELQNQNVEVFIK
jgi:outer membrane protein OmpA-like peptidoglycan-associated protein